MRLLIACIVALSCMVGIAAADLPDIVDDVDEVVYSLEVFLMEHGLSFEEYLEIVDGFELDGIFTHRLDGLDERYTAFWELYEELSEQAVFAYVNVNTDIAFYEEIQEVHEVGSVYYLVNNHYRLPDGYTPDELANILYGYRVRAEVAEAFWVMYEDAKADGINFGVSSAYRSYSTQRRIYNDTVASRGKAYTDTAVARPGHSEHQAGLAIDFTQVNIRFADTAAYAWLVENGHEYGFILRYPDGLREFHGVMYEPWHWRFVGVDIAVAMKDRDIIVYEEFYGRYLHPDVLLNTAELIYEKEQYELEQERLRLEAERQELLRIEQEARERAEAERKAREEALRLAAETIIIEVGSDIERTDNARLPTQTMWLTMMVCIGVLGVGLIVFVIVEEKHGR